MFYGIFVKMILDGFEEEDRDIFLNKILSELFVEGEVGKVPAPLLMMLQILRILQHVNHELYPHRRPYRLITI